jgi:kinesin family protein C1
MNSRGAMAIKHKPSGCNPPMLPQPAANKLLTPSVPEPAYKRKTLMEKAGEYDRKLAAPPNPRPVASGVKATTARGLAASTSRIQPNKSYKQASATSYGASMGPSARAPTASARPKSAYGQHARSKSHSQGMRPATAMMKRHEEDDDDEILERKGVHTFLIPTIPKETLKVVKNAHPPVERRPSSLGGAPKRALHLSKSRSVSSPSHFRPITPVMEEPADPSCDDICNHLGALSIDAPKADSRDSRVGCGKIPGKEPNPFIRPPVSQLPRASPVRQPVTPTLRPISTTPRARVPFFLNRFTNDRCPDFYDDRIEAMERDFRMFKEKLEGDMKHSDNYKETIQQLQTRGRLGGSGRSGNRSGEFLADIGVQLLSSRASARDWSRSTKA